MIAIPKYRVDAELYTSRSTVVVRGRRESDGLPVVIKLLRAEYPTRDALARLRHEHAILTRLGIPEVPRAVALESVRGSLALVLEDTGGEAVGAVARRGGFDLARFLRLAVAIARAVRSIHAQGVIHKDLKPQHMLWGGSGTVLIIDFGISTDLPHERSAVTDADELEGTLAYIAPEQTGRMNRVVDRRSDLYTLGVSLFELATGRLPFPSNDPLELVHSHVAVMPPRADAIEPRVPPVVAAIIEKLMAKAAEDRYQSAAGLQADLERCLASVETTGAVASFDLGARDLCETFELPQKLYGRARALAVVRSAFEQARAGVPHVLLIGGPAGIGKSALVLQLRRQVLLRGQLVSGKFDPLSRSEPYSALAQACRELVRGILRAGPDLVETKRRALALALGANAQLIIERVPELEPLIGSAPPPPPLDPEQARNRFEQVFVGFLGAVVAFDEPTAIFVDDLQWADAASLRLLGKLVTGLQRPILFIGGYRDREITGAHPVLLELEDLERGGTPVTHLVLEPLGPGDIGELLVDALRQPPSEVQALASVLYEKTRGNPFHLARFLEALARDGLLRPDAERQRWVVDLAAVERRRAAANVVEIVLERLRTLTATAQRALGLAACIGDEFELATLARVVELDRTVLAAGLHAALREEMLTPVDDSYRYLSEWATAKDLDVRLRFAHERVHQAAYELIDVGERAAVHLRVGRLLRSALADRPSDEQLFAVARQLNRGATLMTDAAERTWLAELNLERGRKALATGASAIALQHATQAQALMAGSGDPRAQAIAVAARMTQAQCEYVSGRQERALAILDDLDSHTREVLDEVATANLRTTVYTRLGRFADACATFARAMRVLGAELPELADEAGLREAVGQRLRGIRDALAGRDIASLVNLPAMADPLALAQLRTLSGAIPAAYQSNPALNALVVTEAVRLTLEHGATDLTPFVFAQYAVTHLALTSDYATAYDFGRLALELAGVRAGASGAIHFLFGGFIGHWREPVARSLEHFTVGFRCCLESGDLMHASYCMGVGALYRIHAGVPLHEVRASLPAVREVVERMGDVINRDYVTLCERLIASLAGEDAPFGPRTGLGLEGLDVAALSVSGRHFLRWASAILSFFANQHDATLVATSEDLPLPGMVPSIDFAFYAALSHAALARAARGDERERHLHSLREALTRFEAWATLCPANHAHRRALLGAEHADLSGDTGVALDLYETAIVEARRQGFLQNHALACELSGEFHLRSGRVRRGRQDLVEAAHAYRLWGATGKVSQLVARHAALDLEADVDGAAPSEASSNRGGRNSTISTVGTRSLDLESAMRATRAITSELEPDRLLDRLLRILVENAGAQRGVLIVPQGGELVVEAERTVDPDEVVIRHGAVMVASELPEQVVRYVARTRASVVLGDVVADAGDFATDAYLQRPRAMSLFCTSLVHQGQLRAVVYLEHRAAAHAFSPARISRIQFLAAHAASALENSRLYEQVEADRRELEGRVLERTQQLVGLNQDLRNVLDAVSQGLVTIDRGGRVVGQASARAVAWFGSIAEGASWQDVLARQDEHCGRAFSSALAQLVGSPDPWSESMRRIPRRLTTAEGRVLEIDLSPIGGAASWTRMLVVISDVTDQERQRQLEVALRHAQKLEAVGQLAAGIAHEINTPAQFVGDTLGFLEGSFHDLRDLIAQYRGVLSRLGASPGAAELQREVALAESRADLAYVDENAPAAFERARDGMGRISTIVKAMKEFAHPDQRAKEPADLNEALRATLTIAKNEYKYVADVVEDYGDLPLVRCYASDINQVLLNLLVNAAHAIGEVVGTTGTRGVIRVSTERRGDVVRIAIGDTGCGIPEEIRDRVFDPFFTTKPVGKGTGQGLAIAWSIVVDKHGGSLTFDTVVGSGTTFFVVLPVDDRLGAAAENP